MTEPDLIPVDVPPEQLRVGDLLVDDEGYAETIEQVVADAVPEYVYAFTPQQRPYRRDTLVRVHRRRPDPPPPPTAAIEEQLAEVRDLALALADLAGKATQQTVDRVAARAGRVRTRLEETRTDGTDRPGQPAEPAPVLRQSPPVEPPVEPARVEESVGNPPVDDGPPTESGPTPPPDTGGARPDRRGGRAG